MCLAGTFRIAAALCIGVLAAGPVLAVSAEEGCYSTKFQLLQNSLIVVPVLVDGNGPFPFLLDTGSTRTVIDPKLMTRLAPSAGRKGLVDTLGGETWRPLVRLATLSVAGATVHDLFAFSIHNPSLPADITGVLGEDFLEHYDLLINYSDTLLRMEYGMDCLTSAISGERLPVKTQSQSNGRIIRRRLIIEGSRPDLAGMKLSLLLDSGAKTLMLVNDTRRETSQDYLGATGLSGYFPASIAAHVRSVAKLNLGHLELDKQRVIFPAGKLPPQGVDGFLPTALFRAVFIAHSHSYVILNPTLGSAQKTDTRAPMSHP